MLMKVRNAKDEFLITAHKEGRLVLKQRFPQLCNPRMGLPLLKKIMADGFLFYDNTPAIAPQEPVKEQKTEFTPLDVIRHSHYGEFPDAVVTLKLAQRQAVLDGRNPDKAMKHCAGIIANRITNQKLRFTLLDMAITKYPGNHLRNIERTIKLMAKHLTKELGKTIHAESEEQLAQALFQPRKLPLPMG